MVRASVSQLVDLGFIPQVESYQKTLKMVFTASLLGAQHKKRDSVEDKPASVLVMSLGKALTGRLHFYVADRWPTRTSPGYNSAVTNPACRKGQLLDTHQWYSALVVVGQPLAHDWSEMGCYLFPSLISIR